MADQSRTARRQEALYDWRRRMNAEAHISWDSLPTEADLGNIARSQATTRAELERVPAAQSRKMRRYADDIIAVLAQVSGDPAAAPANGAGPRTGPGADGWAGGSPRPERRSAPRWPTFVRYRPAGSAPEVPRARVTVAAEDDDVLRYRWPPLPEKCVIYRVVSDDDAPPFAPELAEPVATTYLTEAEDSTPLCTARRYVQVWAHVGADEASAAATQPRLVAAAAVVAPVRECRVRATGGQVSGSWELADGVERVLVLRLPASVADRQGQAEYDPTYEVCQDQDTRRGFVDEACPPGIHEYRIYAAVELDALTLSPPRRARVVVDAALPPVLDLAVTALPGGDAVRLEWTSESERVRIYLTTDVPRPGVDEAPVELSRLDAAGLPDSARCTEPVDADGVRRTVPRLPLPETQGIVYLTPVTIAGDRAQVGKTVAHTRPSLIKNVQLVERVSLQLVTFSWPETADQVELHKTRPDSPLPDPPGPALDVIDYAGYVARGGMRIRAGQLPERGCDLHLVPVTWFAGEARRGPAAVIRYGGLLRISYRLVGGGTRRVLGAFGRRVLEVCADQDVNRLPFVVVHNPERLPLSPMDGRVLVREVSPLEAGVWTQLKEFRVSRRERGWLRVFVDGDWPVIAVLDPPVDTLGL